MREKHSKTLQNDDWKRWKVGWPYKGDAPDDTEYLKERSEFFRSNAPKNAPYNGWWRGAND